MTLLANLADDGVLARVGISVLIQTTVLIALAAMIARVALRRRADARHSLWLGVLAWLLISPVVSLGFERWGLRLWTLAASPSVEPAALDIEKPPVLALPRSIVLRRDLRPAASVEIGVTAPEVGPMVARPMAPIEPGVIAGHSKPRGLVEIVASVWMLGVAVGLVRIILGYRRLASRLDGATPLDHGRIVEISQSVREALGIASLPPIVVAPDVREPIAIGLIAPRVVLPEGLAESVSSEMLRDIVIHECAHVLRRDLWAGVFQRLAAALYWPHPLVPFMNRRLSQAREEVCDDHVLRTGDRCEYARTLLALTERCRPIGRFDPGLGLLTPRWSLADRVSGILDPRRMIMSRTSLQMKSVVFSGLSLVGLGVASLRFDRRAQAEEPTAEAGKASSRSTIGVWNVTGFVVDEAGRPVPGALVHPGERKPERTLTASDGSFRLAFGDQYNSPGSIIAEAEAGARMGVLEIRSPKAPQEPVRVVLKPARDVVVLVVDSAGSPVPDAAVEAASCARRLVARSFVGTSFVSEVRQDRVYLSHSMTATWRIKCKTDASGKAILRVPADANIRWVVGLKSKVGIDYFENYDSPESEKYTPLPQQLTLKLRPARSIRVTAVDSQGDAVPNVHVSIEAVGLPEKMSAPAFGFGDISEVMTDEKGVAILDWFPEKCTDGRLVFRSDSYSCDPIPLKPRGESPELVGRMLRDTRVSGVVRFKDGRPRARVLLRAEGVYSPGDKGQGLARTDQDGSYHFELRPGQPYLIAAVEEKWASRTVRTGILPEAKPIDGIDMSLIAGTVLDVVTPERAVDEVARSQVGLIETGEPLPEGLRRDGLNNGVFVRYGTSDSAGRLKFRVGPGRYTLNGSGSRGLLAEYQVEVAGDAGPDREISMDWMRPPPDLEPDRTITGIVVEKTPSGDRPVPNAQIQPLCLGRSSGALARTDSSGRFTMRAPPGEWFLLARSVEPPLCGLKRFTVGAEPVTIRVAKGAELRGRVVDSKGKGLARWRIFGSIDTVEKDVSTAGLLFRVYCDEEGRFIYPQLPLGSSGELFVPHDPNVEFGIPQTKVRYQAAKAGTVVIPDLVVPAR